MAKSGSGGLAGWIKNSRESRSSWYAHYQQKVAYPLFLMGALFLFALGIQFSPKQIPAEEQFARWIIALTWVVFAVDYLIGLVLAPNRLTFIRGHILQGAALLFPPLRLLLLGHIFEVMRNTGGRRGNRVRTYVLYVTTLTMVVAAIAVVFFESRNPNSNIKTFSSALWWTAETVSTVGYGDYYPVTWGGRIVAGVLFVNGVALLSVITAGLAQNFLADDASPSDSATSTQKSGSAAVETGTTGAAGDKPDSESTDEGWTHVSENPQELEKVISELERAVSSVRAKVSSGLHGKSSSAGHHPSTAGASTTSDPPRDTPSPEAPTTHDGSDS